MSEVWRRKTYYPSRVLVSTARVVDSSVPDALLCITGSQLEMLRNMTQYLKRRSTFSESESTSGYLSPTTEDWDTIQAIVADLEETLMGCEEFTALFESMLTQLECVCRQIRSVAGTNAALAPIVEDYLGSGVLVPTDTKGHDTAVSAKRCEIAQLVYAQMWDILTIYIQPFQETSADVMLGIILGALVITVGVGGLLIPAATIVAVLLGIADMVVEGNLTNVRNQITANKDELICALYRGLQTDYASAQAEAHLVLADISVLTLADRVILGQLMAPWAIWLATTAWEEQTVWAVSSVASGVCDDCDEIQGVDWWALRIPIEEGLVEFDHTTPGGYWEHHCYTYNLPAGYTLQGVVYVSRNKVGNCDIKRMNGHDACTADVSLWDNHSPPSDPEGRYFAVNPSGIDEDDCKETLAPYATTQEDVTIRSNEEEVSVSWDMGWDCVGTHEMVVEWLVFAGTIPS